jgi:hypothetical protein
MFNSFLKFFFIYIHRVINGASCNWGLHLKSINVTELRILTVTTTSISYKDQVHFTIKISSDQQRIITDFPYKREKVHEKCNKEARLNLRILDHSLMVTQFVTLRNCRYLPTVIFIVRVCYYIFILLDIINKYWVLSLHVYVFLNYALWKSHEEKIEVYRKVIKQHNDWMSFNY